MNLTANTLTHVKSSYNPTAGSQRRFRVHLRREPNARISALDVRMTYKSILGSACLFKIAHFGRQHFGLKETPIETSSLENGERFTQELSPFCSAVEIVE
jgi:hypothetical protein